MTTFNTREESDALIITFDSAAGLNDFRNDSLVMLFTTWFRAGESREWPWISSRSIIFPARVSPS